MSILNSGNDCYHAVRNHLSSRLLSETAEIKNTRLQFNLLFYDGMNMKRSSSF
jgi:hypothetical protein